MNITAVCGWGISKNWFGEVIQNYFPEKVVQVIYPEYPSDPKEAKNLLCDNPADLILGYSLGSLWLLHHKQFLSSFAFKALLAPILAFSKESGIGGKTPQGQLKLMIKFLKENYEDSSILKVFYKVSGLEIPEGFEDFPNRSVLIRGLEFLNKIEKEPVEALNFITIIGENDSLLDAKEIKRQIPHTQVVFKSGHSPEPLIAALSQMFEE